MRKIILVAVATLFVAGPAGAQIRQEVRDARQNVRQEAQDARQGVREAARQERSQIRDDAVARREEMKDQMQARREEAKAKVEDRKAQLQERLKAVKDERKKQAVERIDAGIRQLNDRRTEHFLDVLGKIDLAVGRIENRMTQAEERGKDVGPVRTALASARTALASAREAVTAQAGKAYVVQVNTESTLRSDMSAARKILHDDLMAVQDKVKAAHEAARKAAVALAQVPGIREVPPPPPATSTPSSTQP